MNHYQRGLVVGADPGHRSSNGIIAGILVVLTGLWFMRTKKPEIK